MSEAGFAEVFEELKWILSRHEAELVKSRDAKGDYYLDAPHVMANGKPLFFGAVRVGKRYVSFHLMPVYVWPEMLDSASPELRKRMQGKSCFNFRRPEPQLFRELAELAEAGLERYRRADYLKV